MLKQRRRRWTKNKSMLDQPPVFAGLPRMPMCPQHVKCTLTHKALSHTISIFHPLEVVFRYRDPQLQVGKNTCNCTIRIDIPFRKYIYQFQYVNAHFSLELEGQI